MSDTFNVSIDKAKVKLPTGYYVGTIVDYEIKKFTNSVAIQLTVPVMDECFESKPTIFISDKSNQLSILLSLIGYELPFNGTFNAKDTTGKTVYIRVQEGKGYKGYDLHELVYEFQYKAYHGEPCQSYEKKEDTKEFKKIQTKSEQPKKEEDDFEEPLPKDFEDTLGRFCTYHEPHPTSLHKYKVNFDKLGRKYYVQVNNDEVETEIPF